MWLDPSRNYDLIGDVHGCAQALERLLALLGYHKRAGVWQHPQRQAVFLGDLIDRGPQIRETLLIVRAMVDAGYAHCIMGNHEYYALAWNTPVDDASIQSYVREHSPRHARLQRETHEQFAEHPYDWQDFNQWFLNLPLFIDAERFRAVHACWDDRLINTLRARFPDGRIDTGFIQQSVVSGSLADQTFNRLLRGVNLPLPYGMSQISQDGYRRSSFRTKFWQQEHTSLTYGDVVFQPDALPEHIAQKPLPAQYLRQISGYDEQQPLLFVGHYWRQGQPSLIRPNLACLDYSAVNGGKLVAYRLGQETRLLAHNFVWVDAHD
ncbi:MAG: serine/threonine protein phosphatase [Gammaproteobacteria bacterium]|nr:serine/threonine protein phosphatase [Gammaproteobacteria bacterium]